MVYVVAIIDLFSRKILSHRVSNTMDLAFCKECLYEAVERYGVPAIFNSDQGSQFTSLEFLAILEDLGVEISMDGVGRCLDNVFMERTCNVQYPIMSGINRSMAQTPQTGCYNFAL